MSAARSSLCASALARKSVKSIFPPASQATGTISMPAMAALAGLVPCAEVGNQADAPVRLAAGFVIFLDDQQAGVFALRAGIGLQGAGRPGR
jgi:hypothetical protein